MTIHVKNTYHNYLITCHRHKCEHNTTKISKGELFIINDFRRNSVTTKNFKHVCCGKIIR
jgi:hypothetical protein